MINTQTLYPSVFGRGHDFDHRSPQEIEASISKPLDGLHRYTLINDALVPDTFIHRVRKQCWSGFYFPYGHVFDLDDLFSYEDFAAQLRPAERKVLMHVVLLLIERGEFPFHVPYEPEATVEAE